MTEESLVKLNTAVVFEQFINLNFQYHLVQTKGQKRQICNLNGDIKDAPNETDVLCN